MYFLLNFIQLKNNNTWVHYRNKPPINDVLWKYQEGCERLIVISQSVWWCNPIKRITLQAAWRALSIPAPRNILALTTRPPSGCWWIRPLSGVSGPYDSKPPTHTHTLTTNAWSHTLPITLSDGLQLPSYLAGGKLMVSSPWFNWMSHCSTRISSLLPVKHQMFHFF